MRPCQWARKLGPLGQSVDPNPGRNVTELEESEADWEKLRRWFARLTERDFFGATDRIEAEAVLARGRALDAFTAEAYRHEGLDADAPGGNASR